MIKYSGMPDMFELICTTSFFFVLGTCVRCYWHEEEPGDTRKGAEVILDLVRADGVAKGKEVPKSLVLGSDCFNAVGGICKAELQALTEWKEVIISTDVPKSPSIFDQLVA